MSVKFEKVYNIALIVAQVVFLLLKIFKLIDWSWLWVFSPTWIQIALMIILFLCGFVVYITTKKRLRN